MIIKNAKIFDGENFIEENTVIIEGKLIKKVLKDSDRYKRYGIISRIY